MISEASGGSMSGTLLARCMLQEHSASNLEKDDAPADLALIGAAQRVEHYEMAAYTTARNLAVQMRQSEIVQLLTMSLGEEQNAGQLLDQVARPLLWMARMPATVAKAGSGDILDEGRGKGSSFVGERMLTDRRTSNRNRSAG